MWKSTNALPLLPKSPVMKNSTLLSFLISAIAACSTNPAGHEYHGQSHDHNYCHDHRAPLKVSPADMLIIQKEFKDSIVSMQTRAELLEGFAF